MKTLSTLAIASLSCGLAQAATTYTSSDIYQSSFDKYNGVYGFNTTLSAPSGKTYIQTSGGLPATAYVQSVSLTSRPDGSAVTTPFKLAVYQYAGDGTLNNLLGLSDVAGFSGTNETISLNFDNLELSTASSNTYVFLFVSADATEDLLTAGGTGQYKANYQALALAQNLQVIGCANGGNLQGGSGSYNTNGAGSGGWMTQYMPTYTVTMTDEPVVIPEPTTATLGFAALAALAFKRRRQA